MVQRDTSSKIWKKILRYHLKNPPRGKYQRLYGETLSMMYNMVENAVVIIHICGASSIFLLFCDQKIPNVRNEKWDINIDCPISVQKNTKVFMGQKYPYSKI